MTTFDQHGKFNILNRQDWFTAGVRNGNLLIDDYNTKLINDVLRARRSDITNPTRNTKGNINYLDRIDAMENGFLPYLKYVVR